jgi:protein-S-isoprenylcysteine O-methyltransferase Ste14
MLEWALISFGVGLYYIFPFSSFYFEGFDHIGFYDDVSIRFKYLLVFAIGYMALVPIIFYKKNFENCDSKIARLLEQFKAGKLDKQIILNFILKFLFIPMMYFGLIEYSIRFYDQLAFLITNGMPKGVDNVHFFNQIVFPMFLDFTLAIAVGVYLFGYCVENEKLGSKIKSVDSTWLGWIVTVICYAPIFALVFYVIPKGDQDLAFFKNQEITAFVRAFIMVVVIFKTWTILTLGTKSSNLTNRGIVTKGPYRWIRHPHYLAKLIVWWICLLPSGWAHPFLFGGMIFWTTIYVLRAMTEELHLGKDPDYKAYMKDVKWRFIPGIF